MQTTIARWLALAVLSVSATQCAKAPPVTSVPPDVVTAPLCPAQPAGSGPQAVDRMREAILRQLALQPGWRVGDIGVGGGWFASRVARSLGKDGMVYGTDVDAETIAKLRAAPPIGVDAAPARFTLLTGQRDTGLDDLPDNSLDLLMMIDSVCFEDRQPRDANLTYLRQFLRVLKPGGRFIHHMDCTCRTHVADVEALFVAAGFQLPASRTTLSCAELSTEACPSADAQERAKFLGVFQKTR